MVPTVNHPCIEGLYRLSMFEYEADASEVSRLCCTAPGTDHCDSCGCTQQPRFEGLRVYVSVHFQTQHLLQMEAEP
jgi:hypothetical protein